MDETVRIIPHPDGTRRVVVFRRPGGTCGFEEWEWGDGEQAWFPRGRYSTSITESPDSAEREARRRVGRLARGRCAGD